MQLYNQSNKGLEELTLKPFKLEKEIQALVEENTENLFQLRFIETEFTVQNYRVDSLCLDEENNSLVIIEYKKGNSYSVIDQGMTYLQLMVNNKSDFVLKLSQHFGKVLDVNDIDWTQSKVIFVAESFNSYQKDSVNFKNMPFELWEIKRFSNDTVIFNKHRSTSKQSLDSLTNNSSSSLLKKISSEVKSYEENDLVAKCSQEILEKWEEIKQSVEDLSDVELITKKDYISLMLGTKTVAYFNFFRNKIRMDFNRGNIMEGGKKSKGFFTIDDPKKISGEHNWTWKSGTIGNVYRVTITPSIEVDYIKFLIKQKYNNLINR